MTPKEKAEELLENLWANIGSVYESKEKWLRERSKTKQCALITVDEILKLKLWGKSNGITDRDYWEQVKEEIKNL